MNCDIISGDEFQWYGKEFLSRNVDRAKRKKISSKYHGEERTNQNIHVLCLLLSNHVPLNPGPTATYASIYCEHDNTTDVKSNENGTDS